MGRTRMARTDGRTDGQGGDYMLPRNFSGSIKIKPGLYYQLLTVDVSYMFHVHTSF